MDLRGSDVDLSFLKGVKVAEVHALGEGIVPQPEPQFSLWFQDDTVLTVECFWRLRHHAILLVGRDDKKTDDPHSVDAMEELVRHLVDKTVTDAVVFVTEDLRIEFDGALYLDVMATHAIYESWILSAENGFLAVGRGW